MNDRVVYIRRHTSIQNTIQLIEQSHFDSAFVLDETGAYLGCVSVAELRRLLISGARGDERVDAYPLKHTCKISRQSLSDAKKTGRIISDMELNGARFLPVVDDKGRIAEILSLEKLAQTHGLPEPKDPDYEPHRMILIVGGGGYLGSVLTRKLLARGFRVRVLDSFIYGRRSLEDIVDDGKLEIVEGDFRNINTCVGSLADVDAVILLAAIVGDPASRVRPTETIETNVLAAQALATASKLQHINRFLYASTCSVYGVGAALLDEEAPLNPISLYARTKIESEKIILGLGDDYFSPTILRMGTLYGYSPRMRFDLVVNTMSMKSFVDGKIQVFGGRQWRPLLGVGDAADVYVNCLETPLQAVGNQVFNVGSDNQNYRIEEVAERISASLGGIPILKDDSNLDARDYRVSFSKLTEKLGFAPEETIESAAQVIFNKLHSGAIVNPARRIYYNHFFDSTEE
ncbi:MAG TPA: NAD-dependent epimerase/dehydratase family protein [Acidobacteriota bacterium]|nr:NAD-dependent epimerase/dehydratase family protein [Acidobacteriota bacterium]